jgi:hypothetical protein
MNDESPEKYRQWVTDNLKSDIQEQLFDIYKESMYEHQNDAGRISKTIAKASTLMARLSADQAIAAKRLERFTIALTILTVALIVVAIIQTILMVTFSR